MDKSFFKGLTRREAYLKYFREVLKNIQLYNECDIVYDLLEYLGIDDVVMYHNRKPDFIKLYELRK